MKLNLAPPRRPPCSASKPKPTFTWDQVDALRESSGVAYANAPVGSFTGDEYATKYKITRPTAATQLARLVASGALATGMDLRKTASGRRSRMRVYWLAK